MATKRKPAQANEDRSTAVIKKGATPAEIRVFNIVDNLFRIKKIPICNGDIRSVHKGHRHTIKQHLLSLIEKGLVKRHGYRHYVPAKY